MSTPSLEAICREAAARIPGAKAFADGGLAAPRLHARVDFAPRSWDVLFDTRELAVEPLDLSPAGVWHDVRGFFGFKDVQLDDPRFDAAFDVLAPSPNSRRRCWAFNGRCAIFACGGTSAL